MCLAVPGEILELDELGPLKMGKVSFSGVMRQVCLAYTPDVLVGDYVLVHAGFSITTIDADEADRTLRYLAEIGELE